MPARSLLGRTRRNRRATTRPAPIMSSPPPVRLAFVPDLEFTTSSSSSPCNASMPTACKTLPPPSSPWPKPKGCARTPNRFACVAARRRLPYVRRKKRRLRMLSVRSRIQQLQEYHPPLSRRTGVRLDFNENTVGCSPRVLQRLARITGEDLARYPEREPVEALVARHLDLAPEQVLLTNGVDEAIHLLCEAYLEPGDDMLVVVPTFSMYEIYAAAAGARVTRVHCDMDFAFPLAKILRSLTPATRMIAVASPNNPTGSVAAREQLLQIANAAPQAAVLVDEAYYDFHGET